MRSIGKLGELRQLPGLGPKCERLLAQVGIHTLPQLHETGPIRAYLALESAGLRPSLNFLYALCGALTHRSWQEIARTEKSELLAQLEAEREHRRLVPDDATAR